MKHVTALAIAATCLFTAMAARSAELTLFEIELRNADEAALHTAAVAAGARLIKAADGHRIYDATRIGLPGAQTLEVLFDGGRFVVAAYAFKQNSKTDHELRRILVAKYGEARMVLNGGKQYPIDLTERYAECGSCRWDVEAPLELVYTNLAWSPPAPGSFSGRQTRLTYVNRPLFEDLQRRTAGAAKQVDQERAGQLGRLF